MGSVTLMDHSLGAERRRLFDLSLYVDWLCGADVFWWVRPRLFQSALTQHPCPLAGVQLHFHPVTVLAISKFLKLTQTFDGSQSADNIQSVLTLDNEGNTDSSYSSSLRLGQTFKLHLLHNIHLIGCSADRGTDNQYAAITTLLSKIISTVSSRLSVGNLYALQISYGKKKKPSKVTQQFHIKWFNVL